MKITEVGKYRLEDDYVTCSTIRTRYIRKGTIIEITQIDSQRNKVIGPELLDWEDSELPVHKIKENEG